MTHLKIIIHNFCSRTFSESRDVCEIMWISKVEPDGPRMTMWRMRFACWVTKAANSEYVSPYCFATTTVVTQTRLNITLYVHCLSCFMWTTYTYSHFVIVTLMHTHYDNCDSCIMQYAISSIVSAIFLQGNKANKICQ